MTTKEHSPIADRDDNPAQLLINLQGALKHDALNDIFAIGGVIELDQSQEPLTIRWDSGVVVASDGHPSDGESEPRSRKKRRVEKRRGGAAPRSGGSVESKSKGAAMVDSHSNAGVLAAEVEALHDDGLDDGKWKGGYKVSFPLNGGRASQRAFQQLLKDCQPATFGRGKEEVLDTEYREAGKMDAADYCTNFDPAAYEIMYTLTQALVQSIHLEQKDHVLNGVVAKPYSLNVHISLYPFKAWLTKAVDLL
jgi:hypothetical protein